MLVFCDFTELIFFYLQALHIYYLHGITSSKMVGIFWGLHVSVEASKEKLSTLAICKWIMLYKF